MSAPISRKQAWCKLAILIAEGLPAPVGLDINEDPHGSSIWLRFGTDRAALLAWAEKFDPDRQPLGAAPMLAEDWHGWRVMATVSKPAPIDEDLRVVRHVANHGPAEAVSGG